MNMWTLQSQSAHSAGSTRWSTAVCALQVLLVTVPVASARVHGIWRGNSAGFTASFVGLLSASASLCCANPCKALCFSDTQPKVEIWCFFVFCCSKLWWTLESLKISFTAGTREQMLLFVPTLCSHVRLYRHPNVNFICHCCLSRCFRVDDSAISIHGTNKEIAQYPSAIRQMLWTANRLF